MARSKSRIHIIAKRKKIDAFQAFTEWFQYLQITEIRDGKASNVIDQEKEQQLEDGGLSMGYQNSISNVDSATSLPSDFPFFKKPIEATGKN